MVKNLQDVVKTDIVRVRRFTPESPEEERHLCGLDDWSRPYLNAEEEMQINQGACEYNMYYNLNLQSSKVQTDLLDDARYAKPKGGNPVPKWLAGIDEDQLLDANAFDQYCYGKQAMNHTAAYRNEAELNYHPSKSCFSEFPLIYIDHNNYGAFR